MPTGLGSRPTFSCSHPRSSRYIMTPNALRLEVHRPPQLTAFFTSAPILALSAAVNSFSAKATGHTVPSSRFAFAEAERRVPRLELVRALEEADDIAVLGVRGHPVPGSRREGGRAGFDDGMEPLGLGAIRFRHRGNLREHVAFPVRLLRARAAARFRLQLLGALLHRGSLLVRESLDRLADRGGALGGLLRSLLWAHRPPHTDLGWRRRVDDNDDAITYRLRIHEPQTLLVTRVAEEAFAGPEEDREHHQPQLVDEAVRQQCLHEPGAAMDNDVPCRRLPELRDLLHHVTIEDRRVVPLRLPQRSRDDVLRHAVELVREFTFP